MYKIWHFKEQKPCTQQLRDLPYKETIIVFKLFKLLQIASSLSILPDGNTDHRSLCETVFL